MDGLVGKLNNFHLAVLNSYIVQKLLFQFCLFPCFYEFNSRFMAEMVVSSIHTVILL